VDGIFIGLLLGLVLGMTGIGSGSVLTPLLILHAGMAPERAVGTALLVSFITKSYGSWNFWRRGMVHLGILRELCLGCVPGVVAGAVLIRYLGTQRPEVLHHLLLRAIGAALMLVAATMLWRLLSGGLHQPSGRLFELISRHRKAIVVVCGFGIGAVFAVTSVGSGAAVIPLIVICYGSLPPGRLVGTSIVVGTILAAIAGLAHAGLGTVDWKMTGGLLLGSVPAMWLSGHIHARLPRHVPEGLIALALMAMGIHIFFK
jgi:hypothetical protein